MFAPEFPNFKTQTMNTLGRRDVTRLVSRFACLAFVFACGWFFHHLTAPQVIEPAFTLPQLQAPVVHDSSGAQPVTARDYVVRGTDFNRSQEALLLEWNADDARGRDRDVIAYYLGLIHQKHGDHKEARRWYETAINVSRNTETRQWIESQAATLTRGKSNALGLLPWTTVFSGLLIADGSVPDHKDSLGFYENHVVIAQKELKENDSIVTQVKLMSALMLHAELASKENEGLYALANDQFARADEMRDEVDRRLKSDPGLENELNNVPAVAMRLDTVRIRKEEISEAKKLARAQERLRLELLRDIVIAYRDSAGRYSEAMTQLALEDRASALKQLTLATNDLDRIEGKVKATNDFYLLSDESYRPDPGATAPEDVKTMAPRSPDGGLTYVPTNTFSLSLRSQTGILKGFLGLEAALSNGSLETPDAADAAIKEINTGLDKAKGGDGGNILGHYALGLVSEARGVAITGPSLADPDAIQRGSKEFEDARVRFKRVNDHYKEKSALHRFQQIQDVLAEMLLTARSLVGFANVPGDTSPPLLGKSERRFAELDNAKAFFADASTATANGEHLAAFKVLRRGIERHASRESEGALLWWSWAEAGIRAQQDEGEILRLYDAAAASQLIPGDDYRSGLIRAKLMLSRLLRTFSPKLSRTPKFESLTPEELAACNAELKECDRLLNGALATTKSETSLEAAECYAYLALTTAVRGSMATGGAAETARSLMFYGKAKDAESLLAREAKSDIRLNEALVACRLALGYIAVNVLPDFRSDALTFFSAALDVNSELPANQAAPPQGGNAAPQPLLAPDTKILGAPFINALNKRSVSNESKLLNSETKMRQSWMYFVDGAVALRFSQPDKAHELFGKGLESLLLDENGESKKRTPDAALLVSRTDGVEVTYYARDLMAMVSVLAQIDAGKAEEALRESIRWVSEGKEIAPADAPLEPWLTEATVVRLRGQAERTPMASLLFGRALEEYAASKKMQNFPNRGFYLANAAAAIANSKATMTKEMTDRYPTLEREREDAANRLKDPKQYLDTAKALRAQYRFDEAIDTVIDGIARHQDSVELWSLLIDVVVDHNDITSVKGNFTDPANRHDVYQFLDKAVDAKALTDFDRQYLTGYLRESSGNLKEALASYQLALDSAPKVSEGRLADMHMISRSRVGEIKLRLLMQEKPR